MTNILAIVLEAANLFHNSRSQGRTPVLGLRREVFTIQGRKVIALEQNSAKNSKWAQLAREGHEVVQVKDITDGRDDYMGVVIDNGRQAQVYPTYKP